METKPIIYGETALNKLVEWLRATGKPQNIETVVQEYLRILHKYMREG